MINQVKTVLLLGLLSVLLVGFGGLVAPRYVYAFTVLAIVLNLGAYFFSDRMVLAVHQARELPVEHDPRLHAIVEELAARAGIPKPRLYLIDKPHANAFATGRDPEHGVVAVTAGLRDLLSEREIRGVLSHELAHIKNRDILVASIAAAVASAITWVANVFQFSALFGGGGSQQDGEGDSSSPLGALAMALLAPIAGSLLQLGISRSREYLADERGAVISGDPGALADALERLAEGAKEVPGDEPATASLFIVNPLAGAEGLTALFSTHPPMAERVRRLRAMAARPWPLVA